MTDAIAEVADIRRRVRAFVAEELLPLEPDVIRWELDASRRVEPFEAEAGRSYLFDPLGDLPPEVYERLLAAARERGLWGIDVPAE
ncbi:MAG: hypothetical protein GEV11_07925, partial [Streptosporangiales bacterium]|nr:hypothetical protein [Streptosporangiales bacterium]